MTKRTTSLRAAALVAATIALSACSFPFGGGPPADLYDLSPKSTFDEGLPSVSWQLVVEVPTAAKGLDTDRIAIRPSQLELKYFPQARWTDRAPALVQTLMVESFENSGKIVGVGRRAVGLTADYVLKIEMREFQAERKEGSTAVSVRVRLSLKLVRQSSGIIVASQSFERVEDSPSDAIGDVIKAFDEALGGVYKRAVAWTLIEGERDNTAFRNPTAANPT